MADRDGSGETLRVLLVEDNSDDEFLAIWALKQAGLEQIAVARDGSEALDMLAGETPLPELIILDLRLPKIDGKEVLRRIRADARFIKIPVLILSSSEDIGDKEFCRRYGCIDFVSKPLTAGMVKCFLGLI
jgi:two-component system response regulator